MTPETPITDALWSHLSQHGWGREHLPCSTIMESHEKLERELAEVKADSDSWWDMAHSRKLQADKASRELADAISERDALRKTADKLEEDKESNARLCESLRADWEAERALSDRLAGELQWWGDYCGDNAPASIDLAIAAWKEARK
jgi:hypothetical protein